ncbi:hypothetical protein PG993_009025 [Apiospora rasikravindrae]|uniref:DUF7918 domain-containing protein n=1 Tax=Apiospora rasikravindrae TaxID=990691 RepID=A0ABR1SI66_9PEZI
MAILEEIPGLEVTVQIDGYNVREYTDPYDANRSRGACPKAVKYIESKTGANFAVCLLKEHDFQHLSHHIAFRVHVDSVEAGFFHEPNNFDYREWGVKVDGGSWKNERGVTSYKFRFADFSILPNEDFSLEEIEDHKNEASRIGTIKVSVYDMQDAIFVEEDGHQDRGRSRNSSTADEALQRQDHFAEKAVKGDRALHHSVDFGHRRERLTPHIQYRGGLVRRSVWADPQKRPFAEFEFRYRSMEGLMQEAIVSRTSRMDDEEVREYAQNLERDNARLQAQTNSNGKRSAPDDDSLQTNKRARMDIDPIVIDLTQDDDDEEDDYWW